MICDAAFTDLRIRQFSIYVTRRNRAAFFINSASILYICIPAFVSIRTPAVFSENMMFDAE